jgi:hypothetical protein
MPWIIILNTVEQEAFRPRKEPVALALILPFWSLKALAPASAHRGDQPDHINHSVQ